MNKKQKLILAVGIALIALRLIFPVLEAYNKDRIYATYNFAPFYAEGPLYKTLCKISNSCRVDTTRTLFQILAIASLASFLAYITRAKNERGEEENMKNEKLTIEDYRKGLRGKSFAKYIKNHLKNQSTRKLQAASLGTLRLLPRGAQALGMSFIDKWNLPAYDKDFWRADGSIVFEEIIEDAKNLFKEEQVDFDDETLLNMFRLIAESYAYSASLEPNMRKFMGIDT